MTRLQYLHVHTACRSAEAIPLKGSYRGALRYWLQAWFILLILMCSVILPMHSYFLWTYIFPLPKTRCRHFGFSQLFELIVYRQCNIHINSNYQEWSCVHCVGIKGLQAETRAGCQWKAVLAKLDRTTTTENLDRNTISERCAFSFYHKWNTLLPEVIGNGQNMDQE